jgi:hypothetical protein
MLAQDLKDIFMDLGPPTRHLAPLKLRHKLSDKPIANLIKLHPPPALPSIDPFDDEIHQDLHLFD